MYHLYVPGEGGCQCLPLSLSQKKILGSTNKAHGKLTGVNLVYINSVNIGSINEDDIAKLLCLSVLLNVTKPI